MEIWSQASHSSIRIIPLNFKERNQAKANFYHHQNKQIWIFNPFVENVNFITIVGNFKKTDDFSILNLNRNDSDFIVKTKTERGKFGTKKNNIKQYDLAGLVDVKSK